ncbi:MAG: glycerol-3-phosphate 1-O-acyltransferase PlsY [Firmicutes bacterium]|nr:glycerol-3-phosphate 1-O-acyltransferase PlsY [Bacillota bacterium]
MSFIELQYKGILGIFAESGKLHVAFWIVGLVLCAIIAYLLGSLNFGVIISEKKYRDDIRTHGSGNAGMTNMLRTYGKKAAALTFLLDGLKAVAATFIGLMLCGRLGGYIAGLFCVIGHVYPVFFHFKGGKGVVVTAFMIMVLDPLVFLVLLLVFLIIVGFTKYVSLGSIICMLMYPLVLYNFTPLNSEKFKVIFALIIAVFVIWLHRSNITRLRQGTENKISFKSKKENNTNKKTDGEG